MKRYLCVRYSTEGYQNGACALDAWIVNGLAALGDVLAMAKAGKLTVIEGEQLANECSLKAYQEDGTFGVLLVVSM